MESKILLTLDYTSTVGRTDLLISQKQQGNRKTETPFEGSSNINSMNVKLYIKINATKAWRACKRPFL